MKNSIIILILLLSCQIATGQKSCEEVNKKVETLNQNISFIEPVFDENFAPPPPPPPPPGYQLIYFVHGLGGTTDTWSTASDYVRRNYQTSAERPVYSEFSMDGAGSDLHSSLVNLGTPILETNNIDDPATSFLIGSSQGGIVARAANKFYSDVPATEADRMFGGIVTFGSAHQGARIINNIPVLQQLLEEGCSDVVSAFALGQVPQRALPLVSLTDLQNGVDEICGVVTGFIESQVFGQFLAPITEDYAVGAEKLEELNAFSETSNIPKVAFYGVEEEPIFWRTMNYFTTDPNSLDYFEANEDDELVEWADEFILDIVTKHADAITAYNNAEGVDCPWWTLWGPNIAGCILWEALQDEEDLRTQRDAWAEGLDYMRSLNDQYKMAIGALEIEAEFVSKECICKEYDYGDLVGTNTFFVESDDECYDYNEQDVSCSPQDNFIFNRIEHPSDGVVLASSAGDIPGGIVRPDLNREMVNTSHQQMRNNSELEVKLTTLFGGGVDLFFRIEPQ